MLCLLTILFFSQTSAQWTRDDCLKVAAAWEAGNVPYSQSTRYNTKQYVSSGKGPYRSDCSGFVSAAWDLAPPGATTRTLPHQSISAGELIRCDALLDASHHVALFWGWADASQTRPIVVEEYSTGHFCEQRTWSSLRGFKPVRRNGWNADPASGSGGGGGGGGALPPPPPPRSSRPRPVPTASAESGSGSGSGSGCTVTASTGLNVRSCASTSCRVLRILSSGASVVATGTTSGTWVQISSPVSGWVSSSYVSCGGGGGGFRVEETSTTTTSPNELNVGLIVGLVVVGLFIVIVAAALAIYFVSRHPRSESV